MTYTLPGINTAGILTTHANVIKPAQGGEWEYVIWAVGTGTLKP